MGPWAWPAAVCVVLALCLIWFAHADAKQPARVQQRIPGSVAYRVYNNGRGSIWPSVQKQFGIRPMSLWYANFAPKYNVVLAISPAGLQLGYGTRAPFLSCGPADVINIALVTANALYGVPVFELRKRDGGTDVVPILLMHSFFRGMRRDEGMEAVLAMRKAVGLPELPGDQLWACNPGIVGKDA